MIPGVSRAGATIMGGLLLNLDRRTATEFSFFLAVPTMLAASVLDLYKNWAQMNAENLLVIAIGFVVAFVSALIVVRWLIGFVSRHGFGVFAWYRIAVGLVMAGILLLR
jgi:undecaprenyl-diphosphatase